MRARRSHGATMGQVANDMASDAFCETTIGYKDAANGELFKLA